MAQNFILRTTVSKGVNLVNDGNMRQNKGKRREPAYTIRLEKAFHYFCFQNS